MPLVPVAKHLAVGQAVAEVVERGLGERRVGPAVLLADLVRQANGQSCPHLPGDRLLALGMKPVDGHRHVARLQARALREHERGIAVDAQPVLDVHAGLLADVAPLPVEVHRTEREHGHDVGVGHVDPGERPLAEGVHHHGVSLHEAAEAAQVYAWLEPPLVVHVSRPARLGRHPAGLHEEVVPVRTVGKRLGHLPQPPELMVHVAGHGLAAIPNRHDLLPQGAVGARLPAGGRDVHAGPLVEVGRGEGGVERAAAAGVEIGKHVFGRRGAGRVHRHTAHCLQTPLVGRKRFGQARVTSLPAFEEVLIRLAAHAIGCHRFPKRDVLVGGEDVSDELGRAPADVHAHHRAFDVLLVAPLAAGEPPPPPGDRLRGHRLGRRGLEREADRPWPRQPVRSGDEV